MKMRGTDKLIDLSGREIAEWKMCITLKIIPCGSLKR